MPESERTSIELNCFPLYSSANSEASTSSLKAMTTIERFGAISLRGSVSNVTARVQIQEQRT